MKTRFAPSPTGYLHIGGARTALFAWLFAKSLKGDCLLRIEDTDKERSKTEYTQEIINSFKWLGVEFDAEIVYQSNNATRYREVVESLLANNTAYVCKGEDPEKDKEYRDLKLSKDEDTVIRFKMPETGSTAFEDLVKGKIEVSNDQLDDFIIERSDGSATYNFCVVVDDIDSEISHVIRGDDHINNTFKQINVFKALNQIIPQYGHVPMILGEDGKRLSKRHGALGVQEYEALGILPEALKNYLLRLGWAKGDTEIFSDKEMTASFQDGVMNKSPATFSMDKLLWFNKHYLDQMDTEELIQKINLNHIDKSEYSKMVINAVRDRCETLNDFSTQTDYFFNEPEIYDQKLIKKHCSDATSGYLNKLKSSLVDEDNWNQFAIKGVIDKIALDLEVGFGKIGLPLRLALTASTNSPSIDLVCEILGREETIKRLDSFLLFLNDQEKDL